MKKENIFTTVWLILLLILLLGCFYSISATDEWKDYIKIILTGMALPSILIAFIGPYLAHFLSERKNEIIKKEEIEKIKIVFLDELNKERSKFSDFLAGRIQDYDFDNLRDFHLRWSKNYDLNCLLFRDQNRRIFDEFKIKSNIDLENKAKYKELYELWYGKEKLPKIGLLNNLYEILWNM